MAALTVVRIFVPRILSLVGASPAAPAALPAALAARLARRRRQAWVELRSMAAAALIAARDALLLSWAVSSLAVWLMLALAAGLGVIAPR